MRRVVCLNQVREPIKCRRQCLYIGCIVHYEHIASAKTAPILCEAMLLLFEPQLVGVFEPRRVCRHSLKPCLKHSFAGYLSIRNALHIYTYTHTCIYISLSLYVYICMCIYIYIYIYITVLHACEEGRGASGLRLYSCACR